MFSKDIIMSYIVLFCVLAIGSNVSAKVHRQISGGLASKGSRFPYQDSVKSEGLQKCHKLIIIEAYCAEPFERETIPQNLEAISPGTVLTSTGWGHLSRDDKKLPHDLQSIQPDVGSEIDWHIIGGREAEDGEFPYQVSVQFNGKHDCGGSIIDSKWILTAAHCAYGRSVYTLSVLVGTNQHNFGGELYYVAAKYIHSSFIPATLWDDIALLRLEKDIEFNSKVQTIQLNSLVIYPGAVFTLSGWGWTSLLPQIVRPTNLQTIQLTAMNLEECKPQVISHPVSDTAICTLDIPGRGACKGDSGGPLVYRGKLAGIVSWGEPCALGLPDVFVDVSKYLGWLHNIMTSYN